MTDDPRIDPAEVRNARFPGSSRRYDAKAVDAFLESVASRIVATNALVDRLHQDLEAAKTAAVEVAPAPSPELSLLSDDELVRLVGDETTTVLSTARRAAEEIRSKAEESAARVIREATAEAKRTVDGAKDRVVELTSEAEHARDAAVAAAEVEAERIRQDAERDAHRLVAEAKEQARDHVEAAEAQVSEIKDEASRVLVEAREEGRSMVAEAKEVRGRVLDDLQRRRDTARTQIERLLHGREELLGLYAKVRGQLDDMTSELTEAGPREAGPVAGPDVEEVRVEGLDVEEQDLGEAAVEEVETQEWDVDGPAVEEPAPAVAPIDDTVAPDDTVADVADVVDVVEDVEDSEDSEDVEDSEEVEADAAVVPDEDDEPEPAAQVEEETSAEAEPGADRHEDSTRPGPDVDALFERLRTERAESVARAHEVLEEEPTPSSSVLVTEETEQTEETVTIEAVDETPVDETPVEETPDTAGATDSADGEVAGTGDDVDRVPDEFLAPGVVVTRRTEAIGPLDLSLSRSLKRQLADEQNEVLDQLRRTGSVLVEDLLPDVHSHIAAYARLARADLAAAAAAGAAAVDAAAPPPDVTELALTLGAGLVEPFRRRIERSVAEVDGDSDELDERLRSLYREWKVQHLGPAASDALLSAFARGTLAAASEDAEVRWLIDPEQGPCPDAQDNALAGAVPAGQAFPTGDECPQAHPGCRCHLVVGGP